MKKKNLFLKLFYPQRCRYCARVIDIREELCESCKKTIKRIEGKVCLLCGVSEASCRCKQKKNYYKYICAPFYYEGAISKALWAFKFRERTKLSKIFAEDMAQCFYERYGGYSFDLCTFVPSAKEDFKKRGYNQAELLARGLCEIIGVPCRELLVKRFSTKAQHSLSKIERTGNLSGAIDICDGVELTDMRVLLIDDIKTTGSTLNECAKQLLFAGAAEVFCITVAVANKNEQYNEADNA